MADTYATTSLVLSLSRCVVQQRERTQFEATGNVHMIHCWTCESGECGLVVGCTEWKRYIKLIYERSLPEMCLFRILLLYFLPIFFLCFSSLLSTLAPTAADAMKNTIEPHRRRCHSRYAANEPFERAKLSQTYNEMPKKKNERKNANEMTTAVIYCTLQSGVRWMMIFVTTHESARKSSFGI